MEDSDEVKPDIETRPVTDDSFLEDDVSTNDDNDSDYKPFEEKRRANKRKVASKTKKNPITIKKEPVNAKKPRISRKRKVTGENVPSKKRKAKANLETEIKAQEDFMKTEPCTSDGISSVSLRNVQTPGTLESEASKTISNDYSHFYESWTDEVVVAETTGVPVSVAKNVIALLNQECTIPFIVRYRKEKTGGLHAEKLRDIQVSYEEVKQVHKKVETILRTVKSEKFDKAAASALKGAKTLEEVELLYAPFKPGSKRTLAERSKQLGLEPLTVQILDCRTSILAIDYSTYTKNEKGLESVKDIQTGLQHIIADVFSKDRRVLDFVRSMSKHNLIKFDSKESANAKKLDRRAFVEGKKTENYKYENYFDKQISVKSVTPYQVMALNRGEKQKVLTVKLDIPFEVKQKIKDFIWNTYFYNRNIDAETIKFLTKCVDDSYDRLIEPHMCRQIRSDLTKKAEKESIAVFCSNVKSLLLTPPVRGKTVVGIDPGFSHGCKIAAVSSKGEVLNTDVIYPHVISKRKGDFSDGVKLKTMISTYSAEIIAIGNGTACRETEQWLSDLMASKFFYPFDIKYCIVNESGISIYSVTKEAEAELPNIDPNVRSAVAIARRLQDPLLEYVKIEPKHLGVGMYQHDVPETQLKKALDSVVEECVSFVGVDLNVCPESLLRKISGLTALRAKQIVEWRVKNGPFTNREQLLEVKGLGPKSYEQCAGFVKVLPETSQSTHSSSESGLKGKGIKASHKPNPLDRTIIHPESYNIADRFLIKLDANPYEIGMQSFVDKVKSYMWLKSTEEVANSLNAAVPVMQLIIDAFNQLLDYDIRKEFDQPLFMTSIRKLADLKANQELTGRVMNVAGFGAFVDIGVGKDGLIHKSQMKGRTVSVGEKVTVKVLSVNIEIKRIQLELIKKSSL